MDVDIIEKPKKNISEDIKVSSSTDIVNLKDVQEIRNAIREHLLFIGLDNRNNIRNITLLGIGTSCNVVIDSKEIIRTALYSASNKVILVHNHPSNNLEPSKDDLHLTDVTNEMLKVFNIQLQDHIIVTEKDFISMNKIQKIGKENTYLLINGDGRDLSMIKDKSIDGIITDHPYDLQKALTGGNRKFATFELFRYESKDFKEKQRQKRDIFTKNSQYYYKLLKIFFRL